MLGWLEVECNRCKTRASLPLDAIWRPRGRGRYLRVTCVTPQTLYREWIVQVAHQGAGVP
jgi:hypothetical protein